jgi:intracellular septation protein
MKLLLEFLPWALFAGALWLKDVYVATAVLMIAVCAQMAALYAIDKKLTLMHKVTLAMVLIFGALTLSLHDERFIKWKPTVFSTAIALTLGVALWGLRKNLLRIVVGHQLPLPDAVWQRLTAAWVIYFLFMAALNGYVAAFWSTQAWAAFKLWGFVFPVIFAIGQGFYVAPHLPKDAPEEGGAQPPGGAA